MKQVYLVTRPFRAPFQAYLKVLRLLNTTTEAGGEHSFLIVDNVQIEMVNGKVTLTSFNEEFKLTDEWTDVYKVEVTDSVSHDMIEYALHMKPKLSYIGHLDVWLNFHRLHLPAGPFKEYGPRTECNSFCFHLLKRLFERHDLPELRLCSTKYLVDTFKHSMTKVR